MKFLSYIMRCLVAVLIVAGCSSAIAKERLYGSFIYNSDIPNALFFMDEIKNGDDFELRKALRNREGSSVFKIHKKGSPHRLFFISFLPLHTLNCFLDDSQTLGRVSLKEPPSSKC